MKSKHRRMKVVLATPIVLPATGCCYGCESRRDNRQKCPPQDTPRLRSMSAPASSIYTNSISPAKPRQYYTFKLP